MRRAAAVDANQSAIVAALRKAGCTVQPLHSVGQGCPDLLVGRLGVNYLIEVKDGSKPPSARKLTSHQVEWHGGWNGRVAIAETIGAALDAVGIVFGGVGHG